jgi:hypothetical protein
LARPIWRSRDRSFILLRMDGSHMKLARLRVGHGSILALEPLLRAPSRHSPAAFSPISSELNSGS